ncbi:MAG: NADH-quinone oxidoreductase subunit J [Pirellulales bacterium]|nr:NADH-quinone oxidoreductase subunit J [Pirellulales bacterium]
MSNPQILMLSAFLAAVAIWLMLPRGGARGRWAGAALGAAALGLWLSRTHGLGHWTADGVFYALAAAAIVSAVGAVTSPNPIYCAIWFGMTLLAVAGLLLLVGAQFLAAATVLVYAGAILVTLLFVLMFAQPEGRATCDRVSWEAGLSAAAGIALVGILSAAVGSAVSPTIAAQSPQALAAGVLDPRQTARLGEELFGRRLIAVEVVGTLLLAALVGAAVIVNRFGGRRRDDQKS